MMPGRARGEYPGRAGRNERCGRHLPPLQKGLTVGYGYTAIIVAWLGKLNPLAIILTFLLFRGLLVGGNVLQVAIVC